MKQEILNMLEMQEEMNNRVHYSWRNQNFEWYRAIWIECAELMDHYGYKWWKHQEPDEAQVQLEIVDIWHFGMSCLLQNEIDLVDKNSANYFIEVGEAMGKYAIETSMVKVFGSDCSHWVIDQGLQILGGYGFLEEYLSLIHF